jgi:tetratricopeptide (TPR) repeat protein
LDRFDEVVKAMEATLRLDPHHADALNYLGYSYTERGMKIEEALSLIKRAVSLKPNNGYYVDSLGWAFFKLGQFDDAMGEIYLKQNLIAEAREAWLHSLELDPTNLKLIERFRVQGMGDATSDERVRRAKRRVSAERADTPKAVP